MAQHDYDLANQSRTAFRADLNNALLAIATQNSGATAPSTTYAGMVWWDTAANLIKVRNSANTGWVTVASYDGTTYIPYRAGSPLGTAAVKNTGTSGDVVPLLNQNALHTGHETFQGRLNVADTVGGTVDAITAAHVPAFIGWTDKMRGVFRATGANTSTTPTFAPDGLAAKTIVKENLAALAANDISGAGHEVEWIYNATADKVVLLNPRAAPIATTAEMESGTDLTKMVTPGRQHKHPSASKFFLKCGVTGNILASYNVASITDDGAGALTVTLSELFSSAHYVITCGVLHSVASDVRTIKISSQLAGSFSALCVNGAGTATDPDGGYFFAGLGDQ